MFSIDTKLSGILLGIICSSLIFKHVASFSNNIDPRTIFQWTQIEYKYPTNLERQKDIDSGNFIPGTPVLIDVDVVNPGDPRRKSYFVTTPRFQPGVPATLGKVTYEKRGVNNLIDPYPNWNWHKNPTKCSRDRLVSVFRVKIDSCGRLWVLDTGSYDSKPVCPPQIIAFDLNTDKVIYRYEIPSNVLESNSLLVTPVVDDSDGCQKPFVYCADCQANALIVHDVNKGTTWKIQDKTMYPSPDFGTYTISGESFDLMDGILGMAMNTKQREPKKLFYHAMSTNTEHSVKITDIRNSSRFGSSPTSSPEIFKSYMGRRKSQSPAEAIDENGILYFGDVNSVTLNCWDTSTEYGPANIRTLSNNQTIMQFTSGMKVIDIGRRSQELYIVTNRFQKVSVGTLKPNEVNFRIMYMPLTYQTKRKCM